MADERDEIRSRVSIVDLVGREVALKRTGKTYKGLCPFHQDKNPSFTVNPDVGRYKCWSCGESGDVFTWVMKRQNLDFPEALRVLAREAGIELKDRVTVPASVVEARSSAMDIALKFFRESLAKSEQASSYCKGRGIDAETISAWELGYAPDVGEALAVHLKKQGISLPLAKELFLVDQDAGGGYYDKFRGRLMFPIRDERGVLVAFGGRILGQGQPKYVNSSDTPLYRKSRVLYGLYRGRDAVNTTRKAVLVEGYLDVIACHRAEVTNAIASLGTALSEDHAKLLKRWCDEVIVLYDSDAAGQKAADRAIDILEAHDMRVRLALMPAGDDPDTLLKRSGPEAVQRAVQQGLTPLDYRIANLERDGDPSSSEFWKLAVDLLAKAPTHMDFEHHFVRLAAQYPGFGSDRKRAIDALHTEINRRRAPDDPNVGIRRRWGPKDAPLNRELLRPREIVVLRAFLDEKYRNHGWLFAKMEELFTSKLGKQLSSAVSTAFPAPPAGPTAEWMHKIEPEELRDVFGELSGHFHSQKLDAELIAEAVQKLREEMADRNLVRQRDGIDDDAARQAYLDQLKKRKPDPRQRKEEDDLF